MTTHVCSRKWMNLFFSHCILYKNTGKLNSLVKKSINYMTLAHGTGWTMYVSYMKCMGSHFILGSLLRPCRTRQGLWQSVEVPLGNFDLHLKHLALFMSRLFELRGGWVSPTLSLYKTSCFVNGPSLQNMRKVPFCLFSAHLSQLALSPCCLEPSELVSPSHKRLKLCHHFNTLRLYTDYS